jgi:hypothetical protein
MRKFISSLLMIGLLLGIPVSTNAVVAERAINFESTGGHSHPGTTGPTGGTKVTFPNLSGVASDAQVPDDITITGDITPSSVVSGGPEVSIQSYASFAAAITAIGATKTTLLIDEPTAVSATVATPATLNYRFVSTGTLDIANAVTLTINGDIIATSLLNQIFSYTGSGVVVLSNMEISPGWWGAKFDDSTDDTNPWNYAVAAISAHGGTVLHPGGVSKITAPIVWDGDVNLEGVGRTESEIKNYGNDNCIESIDDGSASVRDIVFRNFKITDGHGSRSTGDGVHLDGKSSGASFFLENVLVKEHDNGFTFLGIIEVVVIRCRSVSNDAIGFYIDRGSDTGTLSTTSIFIETYASSNNIGYWIEQITGFNLIGAIEESSIAQGYYLFNVTTLTGIGVYSENAGTHAFEIDSSVNTTIIGPQFTQVGTSGVKLSKSGVTSPVSNKIIGGKISLDGGSAGYGLDTAGIANGGITLEDTAISGGAGALNNPANRVTRYYFDDTLDATAGTSRQHRQITGNIKYKNSVVYGGIIGPLTGNDTYTLEDGNAFFRNPDAGGYSFDGSGDFLEGHQVTVYNNSGANTFTFNGVTVPVNGSVSMMYSGSTWVTTNIEP